MDEDKRGWNQFRSTKLDRKQFVRRIRKAEGVTQRHAHRFIVRRIDNIRLVSREVVTWLILLGVLIAGLGVQMIVGQYSYTTHGRRDGGLFVEGATGPVSTLNPLFVSTSAESSAARLLFSSLYNYDATGAVHQDLATSMKIDDTHKVYTIGIRDNVMWHDGKKLTAQDIVYTINLIKSPSVRSPLRINWLDVSVRALDEKTVQFSLPAPYAAFPHALTFPVVPQHILKDVAPGAIRESAFSRSPIGSGPFTFKRLQEADAVDHARVIHLLANTAYYAGVPKLSRFELHAYNDEAALLHAITIGEVNGAADVTPTSVAQVKQNKQYNVTTASLDSGVYLLLNTTNPVLKDVKVRKALQIATDTAAIRKAVGGDVVPLDGPLLAHQLKGDDVARAPAVDYTRAATLLDEAGWKLSGDVRTKDGQKLELTITTTSDKAYGSVLPVVKEQWQKIGVKLNSTTVDTTKATSSFVQNTLQGRNFDILLYELVIGSDPDVFAYWHSSQTGTNGYNFSNYSNRLVDASLSSARTRLEPELRNAKYKQFVKQWIDDAPAIALYQPTLDYVTIDGTEAIKAGSTFPTSSDRYANVQYWTVSSKTVYKTP